MKRIIFLLTVVALMVIGGLTVATGAKATRGGSDRCLDPNDLLSYWTEMPQRGLGTITTREGRPLCAEATIVMQSFNVPDTWDRNGWNKTAIPQTSFAKKSFTFPAGKSNHTITMTVETPDKCKNTQVDFFLNEGYDRIDTLTGDDERNIIGVLFAGKKCEEKPKEIQVCRLSDKKYPVTILEKDFDGRLHSMDPNDCKKEEPKKITVCRLSDKKYPVYILEKDFDSSKYSKDSNDCKVAPVTPEEPQQPEELPKTGAVGAISGLIGAGSLAGAGYGYIQSRRRF